MHDQIEDEQGERNVSNTGVLTSKVEAESPKNTEWSIDLTEQDISSVHWRNARKQVEEEVLNKYEVRAEEKRISRNMRRT